MFWERTGDRPVECELRADGYYTQRLPLNPRRPPEVINSSRRLH